MKSELEDYRIQSVGAGKDALAQVFVKMKCQVLKRVDAVLLKM